jgi:hypothetical protein
MFWTRDIYYFTIIYNTIKGASKVKLLKITPFSIFKRPTLYSTNLFNILILTFSNYSSKHFDCISDVVGSL